MNIKENVGVENNQTEAVAEASVGSREAVPNEETSTVLGKFKNVDALTKAYESLQAEFTRRSQRLRTLEKEVENFRSLGGESGAEKLRKAANSRREEAKKFDEFVAEVSCSTAQEKPTLLQNSFPDEGEGVTPEEGSVKVASGEGAAKTPSEDGEGAANSVDYGGMLSSAAKSEGEPMTLEELYERATQNEEVRLRIVGEYLSSLGRSGAPVTGASAGLAVTPPTRAKTVGQAGDMALLYFRKPVQG